MNQSQFLKLAAATSVLLAATSFQTAFAKGGFDEANSLNPACLVQVESDKAYHMVNVSYIKMLQIKKANPKQLEIELASNYYSTSALYQTYNTPQETVKGMVELSQKINFCRENLAKPTNVAPSAGIKP